MGGGGLSSINPFKPIVKVADAAVNTVSNVVSNVNNEVVKPVTNTVANVGANVVNTVADTASAVNNTVIKPVTNTASDVASIVNNEVLKPVTNTAINTVNTVANTVADTASAVNDKLLVPVEDVVAKEVVKPAVNVVEDIVAGAGDIGTSLYKEVLKPLGNSVLQILGIKGKGEQPEDNTKSSVATMAGGSTDLNAQESLQLSKKKRTKLSRGRTLQIPVAQAAPSAAPMGVNV